MSMRSFHWVTAVTLFLALGVPAPHAFGGGNGDAPKVLQLPMRTDGPKSLDPVRGSTVYDNRASAQVYETLLQYEYLARPLKLEPLLLQEMPRTEDSRTYHFTLKQGVRYHDDPCFPGGKGREVVANDVFYSWKRIADDGNLPKCWWLFREAVVGFDEYREAQNRAATGGGKFDYDAPVEGFKVLDDYHFSVTLKSPSQNFLWKLAMFQTSVVPKEAVERYGTRFGRHPVGTGPFVLREEGDWIPGKSIIFHRNPNYHPSFYPSKHMEEDKDHNLHLSAGVRLPIVDRVEITMFVQDEPMWLQFRAGKIGYTQVPSEYFPEAFLKRTRRLKRSYQAQGVAAWPIPLLDFIFRGFNMEDQLLGGYGEKGKALRQALSLAMDWDEHNETFYNGHNVVYDGPIPPRLEGFPRDGKAPVSYRGPDIERAKALLAKAGYPNGEGLPAIEYYSSRGSNIPEQCEMLTRQLGKIGVSLNVNLVDFSTLIEAIKNKKAQFFSFAWSSDYPDAENNLALFYGPNEAPGSNHFNYKRAEYDRLYESILTMPSSDERTKIYEKMRDMVIEDAPFAGSMARTRYYVVNPWLKNFKPTEDFYNWIKYLDVYDAKRPEAQ